MNVDRNTAAIVAHGDGALRVENNLDAIAIAGERFVDRVVDHLVDHVMQARAVIGIADIHAGPLADRIEAFQDLDRIRPVIGRGGSFLAGGVGHARTLRIVSAEWGICGLV